MKKVVSDASTLCIRVAETLLILTGAKNKAMMLDGIYIRVMPNWIVRGGSLQLARSSDPPPWCQILAPLASSWWEKSPYTYPKDIRALQHASLIATLRMHGFVMSWHHAHVQRGPHLARIVDTTCTDTKPAHKSTRQRKYSLYYLKVPDKATRGKYQVNQRSDCPAGKECWISRPKKKPKANKMTNIYSIEWDKSTNLNKV